jgi:protein-disulfide isomerase
MAFRIFIVLLVFLNSYFLYQVIQQSRAHAILEIVPAGYSAGPANADLTVVEFFDYTCPLCRSIDPVLREALKRDGGIRYIPRPVTIDATSAKYVNVAYAAGEQGKFIEMHDAIITDFRSMDDARKAQLAKTLGLDIEKLNKDAQGENVVNKIQENLWLTRYYYTAELPQFLIGDRIIYVPVKTTTVEDFLKIFKEARGLQ